jgi:hypothetical protein
MTLPPVLPHFTLLPQSLFNSTSTRRSSLLSDHGLTHLKASEMLVMNDISVMIGAGATMFMALMSVIIIDATTPLTLSLLILPSSFRHDLISMGGTSKMIL